MCNLSHDNDNENFHKNHESSSLTISGNDSGESSININSALHELLQTSTDDDSQQELFILNITNNNLIEIFNSGDDDCYDNHNSESCDTMSNEIEDYKKTENYNNKPIEADLISAPMLIC